MRRSLSLGQSPARFVIVLAVFLALAGLRGGNIVIADVDTDGDTVPDAADNCPTVPNADQANTDVLQDSKGTRAT